MTIRHACFGAAFIALVASACSPPPHAAVVKCSGTNVSNYHVEKDCTVTVQRFDRPTTATIQADTRKRQAVAAGHFTVEQGTVRIELRSSTGTVAEAVASRAPCACGARTAISTSASTLKVKRPD